ncbi:MAG TPA: EamA/RhaT family transporter, partial [Clostridia bacterium]|nr:EamA/RhaT family transporter [Clostridia bacterium]
MKAKISIIISMIVFGSIGIFVKNINLSSLEIALFRAIIASLFLIAAGVAIKINISIENIKANLL